MVLTSLHTITWLEMCEVPMPTIMRRKHWHAKVRVDRLFPLVPPVQFVAFTYNTYSSSCTTPEACLLTMKKIQIQAIKRGLPDIPYNFCISQFGEIYEARGWDIGSDESLANREVWGNRIDIAYIGNWEKKPPPQQALDSAIHLVNFLVDREYIDKRFDIRQKRERCITYPFKTHKIIDPETGY